MKPATLRMRVWRKKNRQRQRDNDARWRVKNGKKLRAKHKDRYWKHREEELARNAAYTKKNSKHIARRVRLHNHKLTERMHEAMLQKQKNKCAICRKPFIDTPHVDHSHLCCPAVRSCDTCRRGLLCEDCNLGLGRFKDSIAVLRNAIKYLRRHNVS